jgi:broad specificity phosphatase PhoE
LSPKVRAVTTTFFLVRHAAHPFIGRVLVGRVGGVSLAEEGREQARHLARRLAAENIAAVQSSPQARARETALPIAAALGVPLEIAAALDEIDVGEWAGREFAELDADPRWAAWNTQRSVAWAPGGETMDDVRNRIVAHLEQLRTTCPEGKIALVTHGDVIKSAVLHYLRLSLDDYDRIDIDPASVSTIVIGDWGHKIAALNERLPA